MNIARMLSRRFGTEWTALTSAQRELVFNDFRGVLREEFDTPDETMFNGVAEENADAALKEYQLRIGEGNLESYVQSLEAMRS